MNIKVFVQCNKNRTIIYQIVISHTAPPQNTRRTNMNLTPEQLAAAQKANLETLTGITNQALASIEKLVELNMHIAKASLSDSMNNVKKALEIKDVQQLLAHQAEAVQPMAEKMMAYSRHLYELANDTQAGFSKTTEKEMQANRVQDFMNYQIVHVMEEFDEELDQMLFYLPLAGSAFKKTYYDELTKKATSKFVPADDLIVPYTATSLDDAEAIIHRVKISKNELKKQQVAGFYLDIDLGSPRQVEDDVKKKEREDAKLKADKLTREAIQKTILWYSNFYDNKILNTDEKRFGKTIKKAKR